MSHCFVLLAFFLAASPICAQSLFGGSEDSPQVEKPVPFPPYPKKEDLARVDMGPVGSFEVFVDLGSISVSDEGIIRYTLVAQSDGGARNVSFEGIRCKTRERRAYAFGRSDGNWIPARNSRWVEFSQTQFSQIPIVLARDYFCPRLRVVTSTQEAVAALKRGGHPDAKVSP